MLVSPRARGGAERGVESGPRFGPGGGRFSVLEMDGAAELREAETRSVIALWTSQLCIRTLSQTEARAHVRGAFLFCDSTDVEAAQKTVW